MARGTQLLDLVAKFRAEVRQSANVSVGTDNLEHVKQLLRRTQNLLYADPGNDWPFLRMITTKALSAGDRHYNYPTNFNIDRVEAVFVMLNGEPHPLHRGIGIEDYAAFDPDQDERSSPVLKWDVRWTGSAEQIEVWPIPSEAQTLYFSSLRPLRALTSNSDVADLDDDLIVLMAAAEELEGAGLKDAKTKAAMAQKHLENLRKQAAGASPTVRMGQGGDVSPQYASRVNLWVSG